ncbi:hypothetical protein C900_00567 [Fulvivirga imtechensis AK7]|uniref:Uncharacterized protein n=2 Tax=Fulvivirga TaxID=396811 RepID=L8JJ88_9BACT|nr:hypothetical protein C900_00567 [Fulvivirga imtechensis AK7]
MILCLVSIVFVNVNKAWSQTVDKLTGSVSYNMPLWEITSKDLSYPVGLFYSSNGIKVGQGSGSAGMNWSVSSGGSITRVLRGLPDEINTATKKGWLSGTAMEVKNFSPAGDDNYTIATDEYSDFNTISGFGGFDSTTVIKDTEPDLFYINAPGISGMFSFDENGEVLLSPHQNVTVDHTYFSGSIFRFTITTSAGITYTFSLPLKMTIRTEAEDESKIFIDKNNYYNFKSEVSFNSTWHLTMVKSVQGGLISFDYKRFYFKDALSDYHITSWAPYRTDTVFIYSYEFTSNANVKLPQFVYHYEEEQPYTLSAVHGDTHFVKFIEGLHHIPTQFLPSGTRDQRAVNMRQPLINQVEIYENLTADKKVMKKYVLNYRFYRSSPNIIPEDHVRTYYPFLLSVSELNGWYEKPAVRFSYYNINDETGTVLLPQSLSYSRDYYGYPNGYSAIESLPEVYVYPGEEVSERYRPFPIPGYQDRVYVLEGKDTKPDINRMLSGILKTVHLPSGGATEVFYELNDYHDPLSGRNEYGGGLRVSRLLTTDGIDHQNDINTYYSYDATAGISSGKLIHRPQYAFTPGFHIDPRDTTVRYFHELSGSDEEEKWKRITLRHYDNQNWDPVNGGSYVNYEKVTTSQPGLGKTEYEFDIPITYGTTTHGSWTATKTKVARQSPGSGENYYGLGPVITHFSYPFAPQPNYSYLNGELKKSTIYNEAGNILKTMENTYTYLPAIQNIKSLRKERLPLMATGGLKQMFIYSPYELHMMTTPLLLSSVTTNFDANGGHHTTSAEYSYATGDTPYLLSSTSTDAEGTEYKTYHKYNHQYSTVTGSNDKMVQALEKMNALGLEGMPVETYQTIKKSGGTEKVSGASLNFYTFLPGDQLLMESSEGLRLNTPVTDFTGSTVNTTTKMFTKDSRYERMVEMVSTDRYLNVNTVKDRNQQLSTTLYGYRGKIPVLQASGVVAAGIAYNSFETFGLDVLQGNDHELAYSSGYVASSFDGRADSKCIQLNSNNELRKTITREAAHREYIFSIWVKSTGASTVTLLCDDNTTQATGTISITDTGGEWKYYETTIDVSGLSNTFDIMLSTSQSISIDDVLFYPSVATLTYNSLDADLRKTAETNHQGRSTYYEYDEAQRPVLARDHQRNIVSRTTYTTDTDEGIFPVISFEGLITLNVPKEFAVTNIGDPSQVAFLWKIEPLTANPDPEDDNTYTGVTTILSDSKTQLTIPDTLDYMVMCKIVKDTKAYYVSAIVRKDKIVKGELHLTICIDGPVKYDLCGVEDGPAHSCDIPGTADTKFKAEALGASQGVTYYWFWWDSPNQSIHTFGNPVNNPNYPPAHTGQVYLYDRTYHPNDFYLVCIAVDGEKEARSFVYIDYYKSDIGCATE